MNKMSTMRRSLQEPLSTERIQKWKKTLVEMKRTGEMDDKAMTDRAFYWHENVVEVICHRNVKRIEEYAFANCPSLRRVVMPGVKVVERWAFEECSCLKDVECSKLEMIQVEAFSDCYFLRGIDLQSARIVRQYALDGCKSLKDVEFGNELERFFGRRAFGGCISLERITIPLKDGLFGGGYDNGYDDGW